ncbi:MAG: hypothetical protein V4469_02335 [Patescibacteria group bacterium]
MSENKETEIKTASKSYMLSTGEYLGTGLRFLLRSELKEVTGKEKTTLFLMGIPNPVMPYTHVRDYSGDNIINYVYQKSGEAISEFLGETAWLPGTVYYGEMMDDGEFHITGTDKPAWDDGNWGQKAQF